MKHATPAASPLVLALDIGTSSLRTALFDASADRLPATTAQRAYDLRYTADGGAELATEALASAARACLAETLGAWRSNHALSRRPIAGVGISCFWHSLVGVGGGGKAITPIYTWADSRCRDDARALRDQLDERIVHARTGCMLRSSFWPAKLRWLGRVFPRKFASVRLWLSPADWLVRHLLGGAEMGVGLSMASGTGLLDARALRWDAPLVARCAIDASRLPTIDDAPASCQAPLAPQPELGGVPWFPAIGDGAASNLGSGATAPGVAAINVGTSAALRIVRASKSPGAPFGLFRYRVDRERALVGGAVSNAGNLRAWCLRVLRLDEAEIDAAMSRRPGAGHGLSVLPFWSAERAPTWEDDRRGLIAGLTQHTTPLDLLQAITEASFFRIGLIAERVIADGPTPRFIVSGGIQRSRPAVQRLADVLNQTLHPNDEPEASLRGAAVHALTRLGFPEPRSRTGRPIRPRASIAGQYAVARERQRRLESMTAGFDA